MTIQDFNNLNQHRQQKKLLSRGKYITDRTTEDYQALLFELNGFFVEVAYTKQEDEILHVNSFEDTADLAPYLGDIPLSYIV
ncbi:MAG: hypothetical protein ABIN57_07445 [Chitinophagaceae bacterium]